MSLYPKFAIYGLLESPNADPNRYCRILETYACSDGLRTRVVDGIFTLEEAKLKVEILNGKK